jgi:hypothetical protein
LIINHVTSQTKPVKITRTKKKPKHSGRTAKPITEAVKRRTRAELEEAAAVAEHERREWSKTCGRLEKTIADLRVDVSYLDSMLKMIADMRDQPPADDDRAAFFRDQLAGCIELAKVALDRSSYDEYIAKLDNGEEEMPF